MGNESVERTVHGMLRPHNVTGFIIGGSGQRTLPERDFTGCAISGLYCLVRGFYKGAFGNAVYVLPVAAAYGFKKAMREFRLNRIEKIRECRFRTTSRWNVIFKG